MCVFSLASTQIDKPNSLLENQRIIVPKTFRSECFFIQQSNCGSNFSSFVQPSVVHLLTLPLEYFYFPKINDCS